MWHAWERSEKCTRFWRESSNEGDSLEDQGVDGRMGSECILGRLAVECRVHPVGSGEVPVKGSCEYGDERAGSGATQCVSYLGAVS
jgi:hypothetical protein